MPHKGRNIPELYSLLELKGLENGSMVYPLMLRAVPLGVLVGINRHDDQGVKTVEMRAGR